MRLALNLLVTFVGMVIMLYAVALLGGVGTVELSLWTVMLVAALVVVARRSRHKVSS